MNKSALRHGDFDAIPRELVDFARRQVVNAKLYKGDERRREIRHPMVAPVRIVAVDDKNQVIGEPFDLVTRDISASGIGLIHSEEITGDRFAIHMSLAQTDVYMAIAITWTAPLGPFYGAAGWYIERLDRFPT